MQKSHGKPLLPQSQSTTRRRSPRFLSHEKTHEIDHVKTPNSTNNSEVRTLFQSPLTPAYSTISPTKSKRRRKPIKLINGPMKTPSSNAPLRRSQRLSNLHSTPETADVKSRFEDSVSSDPSTKWGSLNVGREGEGQNGRRVSLRLMSLAKGVKDSSGILRRSSSSQNVGCRKERSSVRILDGSCGVSSDCSEKGGWLEVTQKGEGKNVRWVSLRMMGLAKDDSRDILRGSKSLKVARKMGHQRERTSVKVLDDSCCILTQKGNSEEQRRRSVRLMNSGRSGENPIEHSVKRVFAEVTQKQGPRNSHFLRGSGKEFKTSSDFSEEQLHVKSSGEGNCRENNRTSARFMDSSNGIEKPETGTNKHEDLGRKVESEVEKGNSVNSTTVAMRMEGRKKRRKLESREIGTTEKRSEHSKEGCSFEGWTKDQEAALHRAYFKAKPSPHFWKKVSKMVPGKSAQECFDKIHSHLETPSPQPRLRRNKISFSPLSRFKLSGGKLVETLDFNGKKLRNNRQKNLVAQKTVRQLLQKHLLVDQGHQADLYTVLETTTDLPTQALPQTKMPVTPDCVLRPHCHERSSLTLKKTKSKFGTLCRTALTSPPVLKRVKNMALHEKYIDQLHSREARRKKKSSDNVAQEIGVKEMNVKAARAALVSDAKDVIKQYQHLQSVGICEYQVFGDDDDRDGDDECEEGGPC